MSSLLCVDVSIIVLACINLGLLIDSMTEAKRRQDEAQHLPPPAWWSVLVYCTFNVVTLLAIALCRSLPTLCRLTPFPPTHRMNQSAMLSPTSPASHHRSRCPEQPTGPPTAEAVLIEVLRSPPSAVSVLLRRCRVLSGLGAGTSLAVQLFLLIPRTLIMFALFAAVTKVQLTLTQQRT